MRNRRLWVLLGLLGVVTVFWGVSFSQARAMERELGTIAKGLETENQERLAAIVKLPVRVVSDVTAARDYLVFGDATGKITIYMLVQEPSGKQTYHGIDYHYRKTEQDWTMTDSGSYGHGDSTEPARLAFAAMD